MGLFHAFFNDKQVKMIGVEAAGEGLKLLAQTEGIIPALETTHAIAYLEKLARNVKGKKTVIVCLSGRGDKDMGTVKEFL